MKYYNVQCPYCGTVNYRVDLLETNGSMECAVCGRKTIGLLMAFSSVLPPVRQENRGKYRLPSCQNPPGSV